MVLLDFDDRKKNKKNIIIQSSHENDINISSSTIFILRTPNINLDSSDDFPLSKLGSGNKSSRFRIHK